MHGATCTPLQLSASAGTSSIEPWDIEREVKEGYLQDHMRLQDFAEGRCNDARDMRMVMRPLLERYIRYRFPNQILEGKRSEERRVGKECVSKCRSWWSLNH